MFADFIKIAAKLSACVLIVGLFMAVIGLIPTPTPNFTLFSTAIGKGYAILTHWVPGFSACYSIAMACFDLWVGIYVFKLAVFTHRVLLKVMG